MFEKNMQVLTLKSWWLLLRLEIKENEKASSWLTPSYLNFLVIFTSNIPIPAHKSFPLSVPPFISKPLIYSSLISFIFFTFFYWLSLHTHVCVPKYINATIWLPKHDLNKNDTHRYVNMNEGNLSNPTLRIRGNKRNLIEKNSLS